MAQTNYKCGISFAYSGVEWVDWAEEYLFHDRLVTDRRVVYIKATTEIALTHNEFNVSRISTDADTHLNGIRAIGANGLDGVPASGDEGVIRYKVDMDHAPKWRWSKSTGVNRLPAYSAPLKFATLTFPGTATGVLGSTGPVPATPITDRTNYYHRGMLDGVGDEWHTITVADDDAANFLWGGDAEASFKASDGRVMCFVVNPKTPCLSVAVTGDGQFYTTPPKAYGVPKVHEQITYIRPGTGSVSITLRDINGNNVFYRIVSNRADAVTPYTNEGASSVTLTDSAFTGTRYLQYYFAGNAAYTKTRTVIKNPASPGITENHGHLLWGDSAGWDRIAAKLTNPAYVATWNDVKGSSGITRQADWDTYAGTGKRLGGNLISNIGYFVQAAHVNAFCALALGASAKRTTGSAKTYLQYAREMVMENVLTLDPVGGELGQGDAIPSGEITYRGYWDAQLVSDATRAYDILAANFREDQVTGGITPIEEHLVRDLLAAFVVECLQWLGGGHGVKEVPGMWGFARCVAALEVAICIQGYSSPVFGTSGFDGTTTAYPYTPYPTTAATWKALLLDDSVTLTDYPEPMWRIGVTGNGVSSLIVNNVSGNNQWSDKIDYLSFSQMGQWLALLCNLARLHTGKVYTETEALLLRCASGTVTGEKAGAVAAYAPGHSVILDSYNSRLSAVAGAGVPYIQETLGTESAFMRDNRLNTLLWYERTAGMDAVAAPTASPTAGTKENAVTITLSCETPGATIHYTTNGATPTTASTEYTAPFELGVSATVKAIAVADGLDHSAVSSFTYVIDSSGRPAAPTDLVITAIQDEESGPTGYTLTGPASGRVGSARTFAISAVGGTFVGTEVFTPVNTGLTGTFSAATVTPEAGASSVLFQFTGSAASSGTIGVTDNQGWTDPAAIAFTVAAPSSSSGGGFRLRLGLGLGMGGGGRSVGSAILLRYSASDALTEAVFSRASNARYISADRTMQVAGNDNIRNQHYVRDASSAAFVRTLLLERASSNPHLNSHNLWAMYGGTGVTKTANYGIAPDGTTTTTRVQVDGSSRIFRCTSADCGIDEPNAKYCVSVFVRGDVTSIDGIGARGGLFQSIRFALPSIASGWTRVFASGLSGAATALIDFTLRAGSDIELWGVHVEKGVDYPSSYIPSGAVMGARASDLLTLPGSWVEQEITRYERYYPLHSQVEVESVTTETAAGPSPLDVDRCYRNVIYAKGTRSTSYFRSLLGLDAPNESAPAGLRMFKREGNMARTVSFIGDSTTSNASAIFTRLDYLANGVTDSTRPLEGCTILNRGSNGASTLAFLSGSGTYPIASILAEPAADLYVICYGINDVRLGGCSEATLVTRLTNVIEQLRAAFPSADFMLRMPNSLSTDDPTSTGYVTTTGLFAGMSLAQAAQAASTIMRNAYLSFDGRYPNVYVWDTQSSIFGVTCTTIALGGMLGDILHPNVTGQLAVANEFATIVT